MRTIDLLDKALQRGSLYEWQRTLGLSSQALYSARKRGNLSPSIAGALAEHLGENVERWMLIAALEGERDSPCRERMLKRFKMH